MNFLYFSYPAYFAIMWTIHTIPKQIPRIRKYRNESKEKPPITDFSFTKGELKNINYQSPETGKTLFHDGFSNIDKVRWAFKRALIQAQEIDLDIQDNDGNTALHIAAKRNKLAYLRLLLNHKDKTDKEAKHHHEGCSCSYLKINLNMNLANNNGDTPLHIAVAAGNIKIVELLLTRPDIDLNFLNESGETPLILAIDKKNEEIIKLLLAHPNIDLTIQSEDGKTALFTAVKNCDTGIVKLLLAKDNPAINALSTANKEKATEEKDASSPLKCTPLIYVIRYYKAKKHDIVDQLLEHKDIDVNAADSRLCTPLHNAVEYDDMETLSKLLEQRNIEINKPDEDGETSLYFAVFFKNNDALTKLSNHPDIEINYQNDKGKTPLHRAAAEGNEYAVAELLKHRDIDVNLLDNYGKSPLAAALEISPPNRSIVNLLLKQDNIALDKDIATSMIEDPEYVLSEAAIKYIANTVIAYPDDADLNSKIFRAPESSKIGKQIEEYKKKKIPRGYPNFIRDTSSQEQNRNPDDIQSYKQRPSRDPSQCTIL